jgi:hypothetical protein
MPHPLQFFFVLAGLFLIIVALCLADGIIDVCPLPLIGSEHPPNAPVLCVLEYFLNRYQALIGALIALAAAIYAARPVWQQLRLVSVQAATDLIPHLRDEADEYLSDEQFLARVRDIIGRMELAVECMDDPRYAPGLRIGNAIGQIQTARASISALQAIGEKFARRTTLDRAEQQSRGEIITLINRVIGACERTMSTVQPPPGMPIQPYYESISTHFTQEVERNLPPVTESLKEAVASIESHLKIMRSELQSRTELALRAARRFTT